MTAVIVLVTLSYGIVGSVNAVLYLYTPEIYPTRMRAIGTGAATCWLRLASAAGPLLVGYLVAARGTGGRVPDVCRGRARRRGRRRVHARNAEPAARRHRALSYTLLNHEGHEELEGHERKHSTPGLLIFCSDFRDLRDLRDLRG